VTIRKDYFSNSGYDIQKIILEQTWEKVPNLNHREICQKLRRTIDYLVQEKWEDLQRRPALGPFGFKEACTRIKNKFCTTVLYPEKFNYLTLFRELNKEWEAVGIEIPRGSLNVTRAHQKLLQAHLYQKLVDYSLVQIRDKIFFHLHDFAWDMPSQPNALRTYLTEPDVQVAMSGIRTLDLSQLEIRFIPIEITYFSALHELNLSQNHIDHLPDEIGSLKTLRFLNLEDNDLQELPKDFPNWTHLKEVNLKNNPLNATGQAQYDAWINNKAVLR